MTYFTGYIRQKRHSTAIILFLSLALCAGVSWIVFLATSKNMAANLKNLHLDMYSLAACVLFAAIAIVFSFAKRIRITIAQQENDGSLWIEIKDPQLSTPLLLNDPILLSKQWMLVDLGRKNKIKMLYVTLGDRQKKPLLTFTGALGNFYDAPDGFEHVHPQQIIKADQIYDSPKIQDIAYALWCHEDYLLIKEKRNRN